MENDDQLSVLPTHNSGSSIRPPLSALDGVNPTKEAGEADIRQNQSNSRRSSAQSQLRTNVGRYVNTPGHSRRASVRADRNDQVKEMEVQQRTAEVSLDSLGTDEDEMGDTEDC